MTNWNVLSLVAGRPEVDMSKAQLMQEAYLAALFDSSVRERRLGHGAEELEAMLVTELSDDEREVLGCEDRSSRLEHLLDCDIVTTILTCVNMRYRIKDAFRRPPSLAWYNVTFSNIFKSEPAIREYLSLRIPSFCEEEATEMIQYRAALDGCAAEVAANIGTEGLTEDEKERIKGNRERLLISDILQARIQDLKKSMRSKCFADMSRVDRSPHDSEMTEGDDPEQTRSC